MRNTPVPEVKVIDGLRRSNVWFEYAEEGRRRRPRESTKALYERKLLPLAKDLRTICEVGICEGASSLWLWQNIKPDVWVGVDPWFPDRERHTAMFKQCRDNFYWNIEQSGAENLTVPPPGGRIVTEFTFGPTKCFMAEWPSQEFLRRPLWDIIDAGDVPPRFDLAVIDGDHHAAEAITDMVMCWQYLKKGGLLIIDDYERRWLHGKPHVKEAARSFMLAFEDRIEVALECKRQLWLRKITNA
jgi:hypothetical protein